MMGQSESGAFFEDLLFGLLVLGLTWGVSHFFSG